MKSLPKPIRLSLREVDVEVVERAWEGIDRKRGRAARPWLVTGAAFAMAIVLVIALAFRAPAAGPLRADGAIVTAFAGGEQGTRVTLSDRSVVALDRGTTLSVLENTDVSFTTLLTSGVATFDVTPGGPRRWRIELGCGAVEVVGTRFTIDRGASRVVIRVERGAVLVRSDLVRPHRVERLEAGSTLVLELPAAPSSAVEPPPPPASSPALARSDAPLPSTPSPSGEVAELFRRADAARRAGNAGEAATLLRRIASEHASDPRAAVATFTLAKLELDSLGAAGAAANDFARAMEMGLPAAMREDASVRRIEALARAGRLDEARAAAARFRVDHPSSSSLDEIDRWTAAPR